MSCAQLRIQHSSQLLESMRQFFRASFLFFSLLLYLSLSLSFLCFFIHSSSGNFSDLEKHLWRWTPCRGSCVQPIYCTVPRRLHLCNERGGAKQDSAIERKRHITKSNSLESRIARNGLRQMADVSSRWRWTERPVQAEGRAVKETRL